MVVESSIEFLFHLYGLAFTENPFYHPDHTLGKIRRKKIIHGFADKILYWPSQHLFVVSAQLNGSDLIIFEKDIDGNVSKCRNLSSVS